MKRIGIMTFHRSINYGAFMQAYSLSRQIKKRFPEEMVEIIDYTSAIMESIYKPKLSIGTIRHPFAAHLKRKQYKKFREALQKLPLSEKSLCSDGNTAAVLAEYQDDYDLFIVGSDAVWNWCKRGFPNPYLMNFQKPVVKMSYAASAYGMDPSFVGEKEYLYFAETLKDFAFVGVRDQYSKELVKYVCPSCEPTFTCDPTVLLEMQDVYDQLGMQPEVFKAYIQKKYRIDPTKRLIGIMGVPSDIVKRIKKSLGESYVLVGLYHYSKGTDRQLIDLSPFEWAAIFGMFDATVTTYFHGTLLSLWNHTPVINMDFTQFSKNYEGKIRDVMRRMDLLDCYVDDKTVDTVAEQLTAVLASRQNYVEKIRKNFAQLKGSSEAFFERLEEKL